MKLSLQLGHNSVVSRCCSINVILLTLDIGGVSAYEIFGTNDPWTISLTEAQDPGRLPPGDLLIALLHEPVKTEGDVFAFVARVYNDEPFYFQIWRSTGSGANEYQLIASREVTPSVGRDRHENVRLTALYAFRLLCFTRLEISLKKLKL